MKYLAHPPRGGLRPVNGACSGCGSFLHFLAWARRAPFARMAMESEFPDLGTRCTKIMELSVKQAQKEGRGRATSRAGLSYSVVRNTLYKVIKPAGSRPG